MTQTINWTVPLCSFVGALVGPITVHYIAHKYTMFKLKNYPMVYFGMAKGPWWLV